MNKMSKNLVEALIWLVVFPISLGLFGYYFRYSYNLAQDKNNFLPLMLGVLVIFAFLVLYYFKKKKNDPSDSPKI